ncbi:MAG: hypothetical protein ACK55I_15760, partial [bacterium]
MLLDRLPLPDPGVWLAVGSGSLGERGRLRSHRDRRACRCHDDLRVRESRHVLACAITERTDVHCLR